MMRIQVVRLCHTLLCACRYSPQHGGASIAGIVSKHASVSAMWCGCCLAGLIARLCNTLVVAASMAAVSESLAVGKRLGVDSKVLTEVGLQAWQSLHYGSVARCVSCVAHQSV